MILDHSAKFCPNWSVNYRCCCWFPLEHRLKHCLKFSHICVCMIASTVCGNKRLKEGPQFHHQLAPKTYKFSDSRSNGACSKLEQRHACSKFAFSVCLIVAATAHPFGQSTSNSCNWPLGMTVYQSAEFHNFWQYGSMGFQRFNGWMRNT